MKEADKELLARLQEVPNLGDFVGELRDMIANWRDPEKFTPPDGATMSIKEIEALPEHTVPAEGVHCSDPCPTCGAFNMTAQDAAYLGECGVCGFHDYS